MNKVNQPRIHPCVTQAAQELLGFKRVDAKTPTTLYVGGGAACYGWLDGNFRMSKDFDVDMSGMHRHFEIPPEALLPQKLGLWHVDTKYTTNLSVMHEDFDRRALPIAKSGNVTVSLLAPVDVAISKLDRFSERDRGDILALLRSKLVKKEEFIELANDAITTGVGLQSRLELSLRLVLKDHENEMLDAKPDTTQPFRKKCP
jgi:hypothetical protein